MADEAQAPRKIYIQKHPQANQAGIVRVAAAENLISDALCIIEAEIQKYKHKTNSGRGLDLAEARVLHGHIKSLVELSREARERQKADDPSGFSTEELIAMLQASKPKAPSEPQG